MEEPRRGSRNLPAVLILKAEELKDKQEDLDLCKVQSRPSQGCGSYVNYGASLGISSDDVTQSGTQSLQESSDPEKRKTGWGFFFTLVGLSAVQFSSFVSMFILSSFFLHVCEKRDVTGIQGGSIIGMVQGVFLIMAYIFLGLAHKIPLKVQMMIGLSIAGASLVVFAFLDRILNNVVFIVLCLVVRALQGTAVAVTDVCALIVANKASPPEKLSTVIGYMELCVALAQAVSPALGGYLFQVGGYYTPFLVSAGMLFFSALACIPTIPMRVEVEKKYVSEMVKDTFKMQPYFVQFLIFGGFLGFFSGMIEPHLRQFNLTPFLVGLVIFVTNAFSGFTFPVWGYICDAVLKPSYVTLIACVFGAVGFILFGPLPGVPIPEKLWIVIISLALCGTGISGVIIASYAQCRVRLGKVCRNEENADTVISASYIAAYNFGSFLGALLGGIFIDYLGFSRGSAVMLAIQILGALVQIYIMWQRKRGNA